MSTAHLSPEAAGLAETRPLARTSESDGKSFNTAAHGLRGIAALMVFAAHLLGGTAEHIYAAQESYVSAILPYWNAGTFGVCLFFVISGFVILPSARHYDLGEFAVRRFMRLYPLFFTLSLVFIGLNAATNLYPGVNNWQSVVAGLTFTNLLTRTEQLTPNAWSLTFEVWFYLFTALAVHFGLRHRNRIGCFLIGVAATLFLARYPISFYFLGGIAVRLIYDRFETIRVGRHWLPEMAALGLCAFLASRGHYNYRWTDFGNPLVPLLIAATILFFGLAVSRDSLTARALNSPAVRYLGTVSYSLYLVHPYIYYALRVLFQRAGIFEQGVLGPMALFVLVAGLVTLAATSVIHLILERWPYEAVFHQRIYRTQKRQGTSDPALLRS